jgi:deferrochelatase/peroxidase EfeB
MQLSDIDYRDIQGLVRFGHGHLKGARFFALRIADAGAARSWLAARVAAIDDLSKPAPITTAVSGKLPGSALQVAFTYEGLDRLGASPKILGQFSDEFMGGMVEQHRSRRLGDVDANGPNDWEWGRPGEMPHVLVLLYTTVEQLDTCEAKLKDEFWNAAFSQIKCLYTQDNGDIEPFDSADGLSQPVIDWERQKPTRLRATRTYTNISALGEFLLGYPNEYGRYTDRPLVDPRDDLGDVLPLAEDLPGKKDFGRNGTYLVLRDLAQDVPRFWQFVDGQSTHDPSKRRKLAAAMVGRMTSDTPVIPDWRHIVPSDDPKRVIPPGAPIAPLTGDSIPGVGPDMQDIWLNRFTYHKDPHGTACPYGAHIRRANPRNADLPEGTTGWVSRLLRVLGFDSKDPHDDLISSTRFHRILRRGREYGSQLLPEQALKAENDTEARGLRFICLNANISRQFEFIQASWIENAKFDGLDERDPLLGKRAPLWAGGETDAFSVPSDSGVCRRTRGLQQFVTVRGGAYFFLPGISALRYLAHHPNETG